MKLTDLYLSDDELDDCYFNPPTTMANEWLDYKEINRHIANTSANHAVKKVVEWLKQNTIASGYPYGGRYLSLEDWHALKKLVEELDKEH